MDLLRQLCGSAGMSTFGGGDGAELLRVQAEVARLGLLYVTGEGFPQTARPPVWYRRAADQGRGQQQPLGVTGSGPGQDQGSGPSSPSCSTSFVARAR